MHALDVGFDKGFAKAGLKGCKIKPGEARYRSPIQHLS
jgi:hypothetical protein